MSLFGTGTNGLYFRRPYQGNLGPQGLTISCWVKNITGAGSLCQFQTTDGVVQYGLQLSGITILAQQKDSGTVKQSWSAITDNLLPNWNHLAIAIPQSGTVKPYLNGNSSIWSQSSSGAVASTTNWTEFAIGSGLAGGSLPSAAMIAEVAVWRWGLNDQQILQLSQGHSPRRLGAGRLQDYWPLQCDLRNHGSSKVGLSVVGAGNAPKWGEHPPVAPIPRPNLRWRAAPGGKKPGSRWISG